MHKVGDMPNPGFQAPQPLILVRVAALLGSKAACFMPQDLKYIENDLRFFTEDKNTIYFTLTKEYFTAVAG